MSKEIIRVRDVMKRDFDMVDGMATVAEALKNMNFIETKTLIVNKRHEDDEYGIVTLSGVASQVLAADRSPERVNVYEVMTKPAFSVDPEMNIRYCARMFEHFGLVRAPVVEHRTVIGIVSMSDMVLKGLGSGS
ncbi:CBS domain-containing protein [Solemya velum gill symbiont]|uniref:Signal-transduction protein n=1 Tax=Solemya velum gill symbiont TaxID=2340 RepID=A0A0B0H5K8_SOVGS|nr:CBS domain-containing protein [Solemya velum gill symbiont]KHF24355.1 signal-transduction protein [Solemya velum gill symbiont]OOY35215.1 hypothetical protein BOV88_05700 [Solemya velum gill symbiont]OOY37916.1 hypothetical protein BOV89_04615 [Solemya velum gill symbiont]OOY42495.1 hypothetical protein BOV92_13455 [Solemya velum gill symbiont]OOY42531.1 hypothetical protein BOV91_06680 [Solemya velum gill symbiont]